MIAAEVPIARVSRYMGHSSIAVTERVYFHLLPNAHEADLASIDAFLATE
jgi:integrase